MTTPTTPKAGDITEKIMEEFEDKLTKYQKDGGFWIAQPMDDDIDHQRITNFIIQALAKQKESIKKQLRMKMEDMKDYCYDDEVTITLDELSEKLDNL